MNLYVTTSEQSASMISGLSCFDLNGAIVRGLVTRGVSAIVTDLDGILANDHYQGARDAILNPFDPRSRKWDFFGEIEHESDIDQLARAYIPDGGAHDLMWAEHARTFFSDVVGQLLGAAKIDCSRHHFAELSESKYGRIAELYRVLTLEPIERLKKLVEGTASTSLLQEGNERVLGSVRAITCTAIRSLRYFDEHQSGKPFCIRKWIREVSAGDARLVFIPYTRGELVTLRPTLRAWLKIANLEVSKRSVGDNRVCLLIDDLDALGGTPMSLES